MQLSQEQIDGLGDLIDDLEFFVQMNEHIPLLPGGECWDMGADCARESCSEEIKDILDKHSEFIQLIRENESE